MDQTESVSVDLEAGSVTRPLESRSLDKRELAMRFESLGGNGRGAEFASFQRHLGADPRGLLAWADLDHGLLTNALASRFDGVGLAENTIVFLPDRSDEWWSKDKRYWMAKRSFVRADAADADQAAAEICAREDVLRRQLVSDLEAGEKIFVFRNMHRNLSDVELQRLHAAVRAYGDTTLFYVRYADETHLAGSVIVAAPGLLIGYIDHFAFSPNNEPLGPPESAWLELCEKASALHNRQPAISAIRTPDPVAVRRPKVAGARRIVLIGNCQMQAMAGLYRRFVAGRTGDVLQHVPSYQDLTDEHVQAIQQADVVVEQLFDLKPQVDTDTLSTTTPRIFIPMVTAAFLWPFAGSPHPKNKGTPFLTGGPYGGEASDSYLNRLIAAGMEPDEAVETYENLDINSRVKLDRLFEIVMDRQRTRDENAGYQIADVMERHFRTEQIFLSPYHPNARLATELASQFFTQLGAGQDDIDRMRDCTRITPFPKTELPFHPGVCRHFGMDFVAPDRRYRFMNEGLFTWREYALRYMRYEWNDALEEGIYLSGNGKKDEAYERLTEGMRRSPASAAGYNALSHVLSHQGARDEAITAISRAVEIEPEAASYHANLGNLLRLAGQSAAALAELGSAVAAEPGDPHYHVLLAHGLRETGQLREAADVMREAMRLDPYSAKLKADLSVFLEASGDLADAATALQGSITMDPGDEAKHQRLALLLGRLDRFDEAVEEARVALKLAPASTRARITLTGLLLRQGNTAEALTQAHVAADAESESAEAQGQLGHVLYIVNNLQAAEAAFRRAAELNPRNAHFQHEISSILHRQLRTDEAIIAAREATALEPGNPHRLAHLATLLASAGNFGAAQAAQRRAVTLQPAAVALRTRLSDLLAQAG
jgi:tetratricopeptide (TPR) repeat protein